MDVERVAGVVVAIAVAASALVAAARVAPPATAAAATGPTATAPAATALRWTAGELWQRQAAAAHRRLVWPAAAAGVCRASSARSRCR